MAADTAEEVSAVVADTAGEEDLAAEVTAEGNGLLTPNPLLKLILNLTDMAVDSAVDLVDVDMVDVVDMVDADLVEVDMVAVDLVVDITVKCRRTKE